MFKLMKLRILLRRRLRGPLCQCPCSQKEHNGRLFRKPRKKNGRIDMNLLRKERSRKMERPGWRRLRQTIR
jgi:hypothetical protein